MDLRSGYPFWLVKNGFIKSYPSAREDVQTDVIVLGGGITGALVAYHLCKAGIEAVVVDKRNVGMGSTCASTALLQYEIDTPLHQLYHMVGQKNAEKSYQACLDSIDTLKEICERENLQADFEEKKSLFYASFKKDLGIIEAEYAARKKMGIDLVQLSASEVKSEYGFRTAGALLSEKAAQVDAFKLAHGLLDYVAKKGIKVLDNTEVETIENNKGGITVRTQAGFSVRGKKIVYATGYESLAMIEQKIATLHSTYALVSEPIADAQFWKDACLIWETTQPYLYMRSTADKRILIGGKDEPFYSPARRDKLMHRKSKQLEQSFHHLFPHIPFYPDYAWCGTFAETKDGLPFIGKVKQHPHSYFALGFGGNGITFSTIAAQIITEDILGKEHPCAGLFSFERKTTTIKREKALAQ